MLMRASAGSLRDSRSCTLHKCARARTHTATRYHTNTTTTTTIIIIIISIIIIIINNNIIIFSLQQIRQDGAVAGSS
jgi:hypothetical protein